MRTGLDRARSAGAHHLGRDRSQAVFVSDGGARAAYQVLFIEKLQVFSTSVKDVTPLPPPPPDEPVTDQGTIAFGTPVGDHTDGGVTGVDLQNNCTVPPASQGSDGWVTEMPDSFGDGLHAVTVEGNSPAPHDLDLYFYSSDCTVLGSAASSAADESGTLPSGTKYILSHLWLGAQVDVTVTATDTQ